MSYISWALFCEGESDAFYLTVLLPRLMEDIVTRKGVRHSDIPTAPAVRLGKDGRGVDKVAAEACANRAAFEIVFIHADTGGRSLEAQIGSRADEYCSRMNEFCGLPPERCLTLTPRHETEAWVLSDPTAIMSALGYRGDHSAVGLPANAREAERLSDPKSLLAKAMRAISGPRRRGRKVEQIYPAIALRQDFAALRASRSFLAFEARLSACLAAMGCTR